MQQALDTATGIAIPISISLMVVRITTGGLHTGLGTIILTRTVHPPIGRTRVMEGMGIIVHHMVAIGRAEAMAMAMGIAELHALAQG